MTQKTLKKPRFFLTLLLILMSSFPPLSTDMYLSALPSIAKEFGTTGSIVNLTLVLFFIFFAISTLVWGPVSDKFGRKPALVVGLTIYSIASILSVFAPSVYFFITTRIFQAIGAGAPVTISIAIVQDLYKGESKKKILAALSALMMVAPVVAPIFGSLVLSIAGWRVIFGILFMLGFLSLMGSLFIRETKHESVNTTLIEAFSGIFSMLQDKFFRKAILIFSLPALTALGFVGGSSLIFMTGFGVSRTLFTVFFALNATFAIMGSALYVPVTKIVNPKKLVFVAFSVLAICGLLVTLFGKLSPVAFILCVIPGTMMTAMIRPLGVGIMMDCSDDSDAGSASALINFMFTLIGSAGMQIVALNWHDRAITYGCLGIFTGLVCFVSWIFTAKMLHK